MPELPEVETIVRGLAPHVVGRRIANAEILWRRLVSGDPDDAIRRLCGATITGLRRHGKYIVFEIKRRRQRAVFVVHLRMTGNLLLNGETDAYTRGVLLFEDGGTLVYRDIRKFGRWEVAESLPPRLAELGPEPLDIQEEDFIERLRARRGSVKALLLNQEFLRGIGNIYADEALFRACIHPRANAARIGPARARRLRRAIREILSDAIAQGGSSIRNYVNGTGEKGYFQLSTKVYDRTGQPCVTCGVAIRRTVIASRGTHFCPRCQRA